MFVLEPRSRGDEGHDRGVSGEACVPIRLNAASAAASLYHGAWRSGSTTSGGGMRSRAVDVRQAFPELRDVRYERRFKLGEERVAWRGHRFDTQG